MTSQVMKIDNDQVSYHISTTNLMKLFQQFHNFVSICYLLQLKNSVWMDARDLTGKIDTTALEKSYAAQTSEKPEPGKLSCSASVQWCKRTFKQLQQLPRLYLKMLECT